MKIAYFDCFSGVSGDMILAAFLDAGLDLDYFKGQLRRLPLEGYKIGVRKVKKVGLAATAFNVFLARAGRRRRSLREIKNIISKSRLNENVKSLSIKVFEALAAAECKAHGHRRDRMHFHEIGDADSIIDIIGAAIALDYLKFDRVYSSPVNTGSGSVKTVHGIYPLPAPATAILLKGLPAYSCSTDCELATPTGVAILKSVCDGFCPMPLMEIEKVGVGAGAFDINGRPNVLRVFFGDADAEAGYARDNVIVVETNIDDMNPVGTGYILDKIFSAGALDAYFMPVYMKKSRMGMLLSVITEKECLQAVLKIIFDQTTTFGVRTYEAQRYKLARSVKRVRSKYGYARVKLGRIRGRIITVSPEYEDCKKLSQAKGIALRTVYEEVKRAYMRVYER